MRLVVAPGVVELAHDANRARAVGGADVGEVLVRHLAHLVIEVELLERLEQRLLLALELLAPLAGDHGARFFHRRPVLDQRLRRAEREPHDPAERHRRAHKNRHRRAPARPRRIAADSGGDSEHDRRINQGAPASRPHPAHRRGGIGTRRRHRRSARPAPPARWARDASPTSEHHDHQNAGRAEERRHRQHPDQAPITGVERNAHHLFAVLADS